MAEALFHGQSFTKKRRGRGAIAWRFGTTSPRFVAKAPAELPVEAAIHQAVGGCLTDQKANPTYYQIAVDERSYTYVRDNGYYNAQVVNGARQVEFPNDALEIKASSKR